MGSYVGSAKTPTERSSFLVQRSLLWLMAVGHQPLKKEGLLMESTGIEIAKWIVAAIAVFNGGGYIADAVIPVTARQHQRNPLWPPHAKFHNGQTMLMGIGLGLLSLFLLFGLRPLTLPLFLVATAVAGIYFVSMVFATIFPGTAWVDPEFAEKTPRPLGLHPQQLVSYVVCAILIVAVVIAYTVK
jgi:hypothetical protein